VRRGRAANHTTREDIMPSTTEWLKADWDHADEPVPCGRIEVAQVGSAVGIRNGDGAAAALVLEFAPDQVTVFLRAVKDGHFDYLLTH
jgi:sRNA-binding protein